jgi:glucose/arabinose dehydrogenase
MIKKLVGCLMLLSMIYPVTTQAQNPPTFTDEPTGVQYTVERFTPANFPVAMAFAPDGRLFYTEKTTGDVRVVSSDGVLQTEPVIHVDVDGLVERGLLGIALDPDYSENSVIWISYTALATARDWPANTLARFVEQDGVGSELEIMMQIPIDNGELTHNGGNVRFDEAGLLYWSVGDYNTPTNAQDLSVPQGKIHRYEVTEAGLIPAENNVLDDGLFAYGFRNPYDIALDPISGQLWATENGPECDDEVNLVLNGFNYGWGANYRCLGYDLASDISDYMPPHISFTPAFGISGLTFYTSNVIAEWENDLFFCNWAFGTLYRAKIDESRSRILDLYEIDLGDEITCKLGLATGLDGALYFGTVGVGTGSIYRLSVAD